MTTTELFPCDWCQEEVEETTQTMGNNITGREIVDLCDECANNAFQCANDRCGKLGDHYTGAYYVEGENDPFCSGGCQEEREEEKKEEEDNKARLALCPARIVDMAQALVESEYWVGYNNVNDMIINCSDAEIEDNYQHLISGAAADEYQQSIDRNI